MYCPKCNTFLNEEQVVCPTCYEKVRLNIQTKKKDEAKATLENMVVKKVHNPLFIIASICYTLYFVLIVKNMVKVNVIYILLNIIPLIFTFIAVIGLWQSIATKNKNKLINRLKQASIYDGYNKVMYIITIIIFYVLLGLTIIFLILHLFGLVDGLLENLENLPKLGIKITIIIGVILIILIVIFSLIMNFYAKRREYFVHIGNVSNGTKMYNYKRAPVIGSAILGILIIFYAIILLSMSTIEKILNKLLSQIGELEFLNKFLSIIFSSNDLTIILACLFLGLYYFFTAIWMGLVHRSLTAEKEIYKREYNLYDEIDKQTDEEIYALKYKRTRD